MKFVQIVEFKTSKIDEMQAEAASYQQGGGGGAGRGTICADRDNPGTYLVIAEFDSYEAAMANSEAAETQALAAKMAELSDGPATYRNLDVIEEIGG